MVAAEAVDDQDGPCSGRDLHRLVGPVGDSAAAEVTFDALVRAARLLLKKGGVLDGSVSLFSCAGILVDVVGVGAGAVAAVQAGDGRHVRGGEFEAEDVEVLPDPGRRSWPWG